ncbi:hypothetical protein AVEN_22428-1 [Araneus ventricosus]|uniref:Uncharacterized protein n=1 Tax=Araneus ventricosus TaxID=182803 RepID=A0A4Y2W9E0_ARAVE|nr:hypothetical protein AVEN_22428-1 [Araneus ventricosus]
MKVNNAKLNNEWRYQEDSNKKARNQEKESIMHQEKESREESRSGIKKKDIKNRGIKRMYEEEVSRIEDDVASQPSIKEHAVKCQMTCVVALIL